jgi:hypothetical protein
MSYPINYPTPQGANVQIFRGQDGTLSDHQYSRQWVKPQGASFVWFTLIGAGGGGGGAYWDLATAGGGGSSGVVANFMCPAFLIPDELQVRIGRGGAGGAANSNGSDGLNTYLTYQRKNGTGYVLLNVTGGQGGAGGSSGGSGGAAPVAITDNNFTAMGFLNSVDGQAGADSNIARGASPVTFLGGGSGGMISGSVRSTTGNYGYTVTGSSQINAGQGFFQMQPIIVGLGGAPTRSSAGQPVEFLGGGGGVGCGGAGGSTDTAAQVDGAGGRGGDGLVVIVTW